MKCCILLAIPVVSIIKCKIIPIVAMLISIRNLKTIPYNEL